MKVDISNILENKYFPEKSFSIEKMEHGHTNFNYKASSGLDVYFVKIYRDSNIDHIKAETKLIELSVRHGVNIPRIYPTKDGEYFSLYKGFAITVSQFIEGVMPDLSENSSSLIGREIARLHLVPPQEYLPNTYKTTLQLIVRA